MDFITNNSMRMLQKNMDFAWQKIGVISENIANAETPGYKAKYLTFEDELARRLPNKTSSGSGYSSRVRAAIERTGFTLNTTDNETVRLDGNNVVVDAENVEMARTQLQYEFMIQQMNDQISRLRIAIQGR